MGQMRKYFVDLHIHVGFSSEGKPVKMSASKELTFENIAVECRMKKGINVAGIVDCASPRVYEDMQSLMDKGEMVPLKKGGILYRDDLCIIPGAEIETVEKNGCVGHSISFFRDMEAIKKFSDTMKKYIKNINLSSQRAYLSARELFDIVVGHGGVFIPAHCFSPHKSYYGNCTDRLVKLFGAERLEKIVAIELGLSADSELADMISELRDKTFISNSDAHSLSKIAREYNMMLLEELNFEEVVKALKRENGRRVIANYGLDPGLGKYHRTFCEKCGWKNDDEFPGIVCKLCGEANDIVVGVFDRIETIKDFEKPEHPEHRPPYIRQFPLEFIPGIGGRMIQKLVRTFGNEMNVLHHASPQEIAGVTGEKIARYIALASEGRLALDKGGGGVYGKIRGAE